MKIAINTIYSSYNQDQLFCERSCKIGENLLLPSIMLKKKLEAMGHELHTMDMYPVKEIDVILFQEIPAGSILAVQSAVDLIKYVLRKGWKRDDFFRAVSVIPKQHRILLILEPPVVAPKSYNPRLHKFFSKILTWDDLLASKPSYQKIFCPQYIPEEKYAVPFSEKKQFVMIAGNKESEHKKELYSSRREVIKFFEPKHKEFDLFGFGWEKENFYNFRGSVDRKLQTLSQYKYCICFENMKDASGYITEKIFDCFFAGCVPIYWGADNITDHIPKDTFIDMRQFGSIEEMYHYVNSITQEEYEHYLNSAQQYLRSEKYKDTFSVENYVNTIIDCVV